MPGSSCSSCVQKRAARAGGPGVRDLGRTHSLPAPLSVSVNKLSQLSSQQLAAVTDSPMPVQHFLLATPNFNTSICKILGKEESSFHEEICEYQVFLQATEENKLPMASTTCQLNHRFTASPFLGERGSQSILHPAWSP